MKYPPEPIQYAYARLVSLIFIHIRNDLCSCVEMQRDLADALHNISDILTNYGGFVDDEKYRDLYIRKYDQKWESAGLTLERILDDSIAEYPKWAAIKKSQLMQQHNDEEFEVIEEP